MVLGIPSSGDLEMVAKEGKRLAEDIERYGPIIESLTPKLDYLVEKLAAMPTAEEVRTLTVVIEALRQELREASAKHVV